MVVGIALTLTLAAGGCSGDDDGGGDRGGAVGGTDAAAAGGVDSTLSEASATTDGRGVESSAPELAASTTDRIAPVPEEGVPGIDSSDPFCRAWSEFAGSFQVLAFVSAGESDPLASLRLEVVAAAAVTSAVLELDTEFPDPIASEQDVFVEEVIGPFARRAARAVEALEMSGLAPGELEALGDAWLEALAETGVDDPEILVTLPAELEAAVGDAIAALSATLPPIASDPSLITQAETPATFGYLADQCPDQGTLAGNDAID